MIERSNNRAREIFEECKAIVPGHFVGTAMERAHLDTYVAKMRVFRDATKLTALAECVVELMEDEIARTDFLVARPTAGLYLMAACGMIIQVCWPQKKIGMLYVTTNAQGQPGFPSDERSLVRDANCIALDDIVDSGHTGRMLVAAIQNAGGNVIGMYASCNRGIVTAGPDPETQIPVRKLQTCFTLSLRTYTEATCPLCQRGEPIRTDLGHGAEWLKRKAADHIVTI